MTPTLTGNPLYSIVSEALSLKVSEKNIALYNNITQEEVCM